MTEPDDVPDAELEPDLPGPHARDPADSRARKAARPERHNAEARAEPETEQPSSLEPVYEQLQREQRTRIEDKDEPIDGANRPGSPG